jgi:hypothetical protein
VASKAEGIIHRNLDRCLSRLIGHIVEITRRIEVLVIDRRRQDPTLQGHDAGDALDCAGCSQQVSRHRFCGTDGERASMLAKDRLQGFRLEAIASDGRRTVGIDVSHLFRSHACIPKGNIHRPRRSFATGSHIGHMMGISCKSKTEKFAEDLRTTGTSMFVLLQNQSPRTLAKDKAVTLRVEGTTRFFGSRVARARAALKPAIDISVTVASVPPVTITSASSY